VTGAGGDEVAKPGVNGCSCAVAERPGVTGAFLALALLLGALRRRNRVG
jgi:MYXO-CTERM domain-containing protein